MASCSPRQSRSQRRRRGTVVLLVVLATLAALLGSVARWIDRQVLDTQQWTQTSSQLIAHPKIRAAVMAYAVDELFDRAKLDGTLRRVLPRAAVGPAEAKLRRRAHSLAADILGARPAQEIFRQASRQAQRQLLDILDQRGPLTHQNQAVTLNLGPLLKQLVRALLASDIVRALPGGGRIFGTGSPSGGRLVILRPAQVRQARAFVETVRGLSVVLPLAAIVLFAGAVALARGWRRIALGWVGLCLAAVGTTALRDTALATLLLGALVFAASAALRLAARVAQRRPSTAGRLPA